MHHYNGQPIREINDEGLLFNLRYLLGAESWPHWSLWVCIGALAILLAIRFNPFRRAGVARRP